MNRLIRIGFTAGLVALLSGCVFVNGEGGWSKVDWEDEQEENRRVIAQLDIGATRDEVETRLGTPNNSEAFTREGEEYRVLFFRTRHRHSDGKTTRDESTPLIFKNDRLIGWGDEVLASIR